MQRYTNNVTDGSGNAINGASISVVLYGTSTPASLFADSAGATPIANPIATDELGFFAFYAANGRYTITATYGVVSKTIADVDLFDLFASPLAASFSASDGAGGSLWTTVQGAFNYIKSSLGSGVIGFTQAGTSAVARWLQDKARDIISAKDFGALGDGTTNDTTGITAVDAIGKTIYVPDGDYPTTLATLASPYIGGGRIKLNRLSLNLFNEQAPKAIHAFGSSVLGNLNTIDTAIKAGAANVVIWGDSISEGISNVAYDDSYAGLIQEWLTDALPGVTFTFSNYSISGTVTADAASATYVGAASDSYPTQFYRTAGSANVGNFQPGTPLWPSGSTIGKTWRDHIKDATPDLLFIAFGANEVATAPSNVANNLQTIINYIATWPKVPTIALITNLQATRATAPWSGYNANLQAVAEAIRGIAHNNPTINLIDANRLHLIYRDGLDVVRPSKRLSYTFAGGFTENWPTNWESNGTLPTVSGTYNLTFSAPGNTEKIDSATDVHLSANFTNVAAASSAFDIVYRSAGVGSSLKYNVQVTTNAPGTVSTVIAYYNSVAIASSAVPTVVNGETVLVEVECVGAHHVVKVRGIKYLDFYDYQNLSAGKYGVQWGAGAGTIGNWVARIGNYRVVGAPKLTDKHVYGYANDWLTNDASTGGDTIHHPGALGHQAIYLGAAANFLQRVAAAASRVKNEQVTSSVTDTAITLALNDYIDLSIAGVSNGSVMVTSSVANNSYGATATHFKKITGTSAVILVSKNGVATALTTTLTLPGGGDWLVFASASLSGVGATLRHTLTATAIRM